MPIFQGTALGCTEGPHLYLHDEFALGPELDATKLSDEYTTLGLGFTGAYAALCAHDVSGRGRSADFDYFEYSET